MRTIDFDEPPEEEERGRGPRRDDPGDILEEYQAPVDWTLGLAWDVDNGWMWGLRFNSRPLMLYAIDPQDGEDVHAAEVQEDGK